MPRNSQYSTTVNSSYTRKRKPTRSRRSSKRKSSRPRRSYQRRSYQRKSSKGNRSRRKSTRGKRSQTVSRYPYPKKYSYNYTDEDYQAVLRDINPISRLRYTKSMKRAQPTPEASSPTSEASSLADEPIEDGFGGVI